MIQFSNLKSQIDPNLLIYLYELSINNEFNIINCYGLLMNGIIRICKECEAFDLAISGNSNNKGSLYLFTSQTQFKQFDKQMKYQEILQNIHQIEFIMFAFIDLKRYKIEYLFCIPSYGYNRVSVLEELDHSNTYITLDNHLTRILEYTKTNSTFVILNKLNNEVSNITNLSISNYTNYHIILINNPLYLLNRIAYYYLWKLLGEVTIEILYINMKLQGYKIELLNMVDIKQVGWERNNDNLLLHSVNLMSLLDKNYITKQAVNLNLNLMKWRLMPDIDLEKISKQKCLLFGAGTLGIDRFIKGCNIGRALIGWGVNTIGFIDNSLVSYSNPFRQSLFELKHVGMQKSTIAALKLQEIYPGTVFTLT